MSETNSERPEGAALDRVLDLPLEIHVELGRRRVRIAELLTLAPGSILELDAAAGAPLSILANRVVIAKGEAVVVGERYGVRVTDVVSQRDRVRGLGSTGGGT